VAQDGAKMAQDGAKMGQDGALMIPDGVKMEPRWAKMAAETRAIFFFPKIHLYSRGTPRIFFVHEVLASNCDCQNFMHKLPCIPPVERSISLRRDWKLGGLEAWTFGGLEN
jgi:hypothetical protein